MRGGYGMRLLDIYVSMRRRWGLALVRMYVCTYVYILA